MILVFDIIGFQCVMFIATDSVELYVSTLNLFQDMTGTNKNWTFAAIAQSGIQPSGEESPFVVLDSDHSQPKQSVTPRPIVQLPALATSIQTACLDRAIAGKLCQIIEFYVCFFNVGTSVICKQKMSNTFHTKQGHFQLPNSKIQPGRQKEGPCAGFSKKKIMWDMHTALSNFVLLSL